VSVEECVRRLTSHGWEVREIGGSGLWLVVGTNGDKSLYVRGLTQDEAWNLATERAINENRPKPRG